MLTILFTSAVLCAVALIMFMRKEKDFRQEFLQAFQEQKEKVCFLEEESKRKHEENFKYWCELMTQQKEMSVSSKEFYETQNLRCENMMINLGLHEQFINEINDKIKMFELHHKNNLEMWRSYYGEIKNLKENILNNFERYDLLEPELSVLKSSISSKFSCIDEEQIDLDEDIIDINKKIEKMESQLKKLKIKAIVKPKKIKVVK